MLLSDVSCYFLRRFAIMKYCKGSTKGSAKGLPKFVLLQTYMKVSKVIRYSQYVVLCIDHIALGVGNLELVVVFWVG